MTHRDDILTVVRGETSALLRAEVRALSQRGQLERAVVDAIRKYGLGIDEVSEASGLTPVEIRLLLERPGAWGEEDEVADLAGVV